MRRKVCVQNLARKTVIQISTKPFRMTTYISFTILLDYLGIFSNANWVN